MQHSHLNVNAQEVLTYKLHDGEITADLEDLCVIHLEINENDDQPTHRCADCGEPLSEYPDGWRDPEHSTACTDTDGLHNPFPEPLSWINSASIMPDPDEDSLTVSISVGDPRGAFCMTVRKLGGTIILSVPHANMLSPHLPLVRVRAGTYQVGA